MFLRKKLACWGGDICDDWNWPLPLPVQEVMMMMMMMMMRWWWWWCNVWAYVWQILCMSSFSPPDLRYFLLSPNKRPLAVRQFLFLGTPRGPSIAGSRPLLWHLTCLDRCRSAAASGTSSLKDTPLLLAPASDRRVSDAISIVIGWVKWATMAGDGWSHAIIRIKLYTLLGQSHVKNCKIYTQGKNTTHSKPQLDQPTPSGTLKMNCSRNHWSLG